MRSADSFATLFEQHRRVLQRQAGRLLRGTGLDPDDVLQDVYLRAHKALESGVVPIEPRAWLLRLVRNACLDELRRVKARPIAEVVLEAVPSGQSGLPDELSDRAEARALLGDIHRLPDRQRSVLVMSALDGLSHEEVAEHLDTTVNTTRSLLARARENLRRTAAARETACGSVEAALEEAVLSGVRASELARRHLWSCADCRSFQRDLRTRPSRLRRLASWSPWAVVAQLLSGGGKAAVGVCCALVVGGGAVTVPVVEYTRHATGDAALAAAPEPSPPKSSAARRATPPSRPVTSVATPAAHFASFDPTPVATAAPTPVKAAEKTRRPAHGRPDVKQQRQFNAAFRAIIARAPSGEQRTRILAMVRAYYKAPKGSTRRTRALRRLQAELFTRPSLPPGVATTPAPAVPVATPVVPTSAPRTPAPVAPAATPAATPGAPAATATPVATETAASTPVETPTAIASASPAATTP